MEPQNWNLPAPRLTSPIYWAIYGSDVEPCPNEGYRGGGGASFGRLDGSSLADIRRLSKILSVAIEKSGFTTMRRVLSKLQLTSSNCIYVTRPQNMVLRTPRQVHAACCHLVSIRHQVTNLYLSPQRNYSRRNGPQTTWTELNLNRTDLQARSSLS